MIDPAAFRFVVHSEGMLQMDGHLGPRLYIHSGEGLAVKLIHPLRHIPYATSQNLAHGLVAADACRAHRSVRPHVRRPTAARINKRRGARAGGCDERLGAQVLLSVTAPIARHASNTVGIADPPQALLLVVALIIALAVLRASANRAVMTARNGGVEGK